jgi:hypothetical protein
MGTLRQAPVVTVPHLPVLYSQATPCGAALARAPLVSEPHTTKIHKFKPLSQPIISINNATNCSPPNHTHNQSTMLKRAEKRQQTPNTSWSGHRHAL